jgi:DNA-binding MarR family transcriptional regulator
MKYENASKIVKNRLTQDDEMIVHKDTFASKELTSSEKWVLASIWHLAHLGECYATNKEIGQNIGLSFQTVSQRVVSLEQKGFIKKESFYAERNDDTGGNHVRKIKLL